MTAARDEALAVLRAMEWDDGHSCQMCHGLNPEQFSTKNPHIASRRGHRPDCRLFQVISGLVTEQSGNGNMDSDPEPVVTPELRRHYEKFKDNERPRAATIKQSIEALAKLPCPFRAWIDGRDGCLMHSAARSGRCDVCPDTPRSSKDRTSEADIHRMYASAKAAMPWAGSDLVRGPDRPSGVTDEVVERACRAAVRDQYRFRVSIVELERRVEAEWKNHERIVRSSLKSIWPTPDPSKARRDALEEVRQVVAQAAEHCRSQSKSTIADFQTGALAMADFIEAIADQRIRALINISD